MKFITDDVARTYAMKVAEMRARQIVAWDREMHILNDVPCMIDALREAAELENEVDRLTLALLDDRSYLDDEPVEGG